MTRTRAVARTAMGCAQWVWRPWGTAPSPRPSPTSSARLWQDKISLGMAIWARARTGERHERPSTPIQNPCLRDRRCISNRRPTRLRVISRSTGWLPHGAAAISTRQVWELHCLRQIPPLAAAAGSPGPLCRPTSCDGLGPEGAPPSPCRRSTLPIALVLGLPFVAGRAL